MQQQLDKGMLQDVLRKNSEALAVSTRGGVSERELLVSERRACRVTRTNRGTYRYRAHKDPPTALRIRIREIARTRVRYGYRRSWHCCTREWERRWCSGLNRPQRQWEA